MSGDLPNLMKALADASPEQRDKVLGETAPRDLNLLTEAFEWQARFAQRPPPGEWRTWLILAGRGFGKTRAGAEWVLSRARANPGARIALVGASIEDAARVMIEGESGLIACKRTGETVKFRRSVREVDLPEGGIGHVFSGASPDRLRGAQHHFEGRRSPERAEPPTPNCQSSEES